MLQITDKYFSFYSHRGSTIHQCSTSHTPGRSIVRLWLQRRNDANESRMCRHIPCTTEGTLISRHFRRQWNLYKLIQSMHADMHTWHTYMISVSILTNPRYTICHYRIVHPIALMPMRSIRFPPISMLRCHKPFRTSCCNHRTNPYPFNTHTHTQIERETHLQK